MDIKKFFLQIVYSIALCFSFSCISRTIYRPQDPKMPRIETEWISTNQQPVQKYILKSWYLSESALFKTFDKEYFFSHLLPQGPLSLRYEPEKTIVGTELDDLINGVVKEILNNTKPQKEYTHFKVLKNRDFNHKTHSGLIVLRVKSKKMPFVVKLFMETPQTFVRPYSKGFQPSCFFVMGKGINRYLAGFTRLKNQEAIAKIIENDPELHGKVTMPRKFYWLPHTPEWFKLTGYNIGLQEVQSIELPSIYGIVCDYIDGERSLDFFNYDDRILGMNLTKKFGNRLDPHIDNFVLEKKNEKTPEAPQTLAIIDTEHFASITGLRKEEDFSNYFTWYTKLANKFLGDSLGKSKQQRIKEQSEPTPSTLII